MICEQVIEDDSGDNDGRKQAHQNADSERHCEAPAGPVPNWKSTKAR